MNGKFVKMTNPMQAHVALRNRKVVCYGIEDAVGCMYADKKWITMIIQDYDGKNKQTAYADFSKLTGTLNDLKEVDFYIYDCGNIQALPSSVVNEFIKEVNRNE